MKPATRDGACVHGLDGVYSVIWTFLISACIFGAIINNGTARSAYDMAEGREIVYFICLYFVGTFDSKSLRLLFAGE